MSRRNLWIDDELHERIVEAARAETVANKGEPTSVAEWVRQACRLRLERAALQHDSGDR